MSDKDIFTVSAVAPRPQQAGAFLAMMFLLVLIGAGTVFGLNVLGISKDVVKMSSQVTEKPSKPDDDNNPEPSTNDCPDDSGISYREDIRPLPTPSQDRDYWRYRDNSGCRVFNGDPCWLPQYLKNGD